MAYSQDWIFKKEFLENVNSVRFSQSTDIRKEKENRFKTVWFIKDLSNALRPGPAVETSRDRKDEEADYDIRNLKVLWTACAFFHRFYVFHSFGAHQRFSVAVACLFLASKVEEKPLRLSDHIFMYFRLRKNEIVKKTDPQFKDTEKEVLLSERILLQTLGFDLNVVHPYQFFRQIIGKDLKAWFADPEDSKQVLRLATNLLTDSYRSTLCLLYTPQQLAVGLIFLALQIMGLKPQAPAGSGMYGSRPSYSPATVTQDGSSDQSWLELLEKDVEESVVRDICFTMVELYETSFAPADVPYAASTQAHAALRKGLSGELDRVAAMRVNAAEREGVEEHKGSVSADDLAAKAGSDPADGTSSSGSSGSSNKRKLSIDGAGAPGLATSGLGSITKSRYTTLPPAFSDAATTATGSAAKVLFPSGAASASLSVSITAGGGASPVVNAPTPRGYRPVSIPSNVSPDALPLPPPMDSPGSAYSTFSQAHAHIHGHAHAQGQGQGQGQAYRAVSGPEAEAEEHGKDRDDHERLLNGSGLESPEFLPPPPPPDTPGSMASTPNFENLPRAGEFGHHLPDQFSLQHAKRPRMDY